MPPAFNRPGEVVVYAQISSPLPFKRFHLRIHIHGRGSISAAGPDPATAWETYVSGKRTWREDPESGLPVYPVAGGFSAGVRDFAGSRQCSRTATLALAAAEQAVREAGWIGGDFAILVGCSRGPTGSWESTFREFTQYGRVEPRTSPATTLGSIGFALGEFFANTSLASSLSVTCSSGAHALLHGVALLESGMAERVLVGGAEGPLTAFTLRQMQALRIYAEAPGTDQHACRPLSDRPSGLVVGEGAAFLALSKSPRHLPSGAQYPAISGLGFSREAGKTATGISPEGDGLFASMQMAIAGQRMPDVIVAHAPGTPKGDRAERKAIKKLGPQIPATSFKWATGHTFGASGPLAIDGAISGLLHRRFLSTPYPRKVNQPTSPASALINATGFGGNAVSVLLDASPTDTPD